METGSVRKDLENGIEMMLLVDTELAIGIAFPPHCR